MGDCSRTCGPRTKTLDGHLMDRQQDTDGLEDKNQKHFATISFLLLVAMASNLLAMAST